MNPATRRARVLSVLAAVPVVIMLLFHPRHLQSVQQVPHSICWRCGMDGALWGILLICTGICGRCLLVGWELTQLGPLGIRILKLFFGLAICIGVAGVLFACCFVFAYRHQANVD